MIIGIGSDNLWIERFRRSLTRFGLGYLEETFTPEELERSPCFGDPATFYARAFCAKEACSKALGTGITEDVDWYDIEIIQQRDGTEIHLTEGALRQLRSFTPANAEAVIHADVRSEKGIAYAFVVIEVRLW